MLDVLLAVLEHGCRASGSAAKSEERQVAPSLTSQLWCLCDRQRHQPTQIVVATSPHSRQNTARLAERARPLHCAVSLHLPVRCDSQRRTENPPVRFDLRLALKALSRYPAPSATRASCFTCIPSLHRQRLNPDSSLHPSTVRCKPKRPPLAHETTS